MNPIIEIQHLVLLKLEIDLIHLHIDRRAGSNMPLLLI